MAKNTNLCIFTGHLTKDPEMRFTTDGKAITKFGIAVNGYKDGEACFPYFVAFGKVGEVCGEYLKKGSKVLVTASYKQNNYEKDGEKKTSHEFIVQDVELPPKGIKQEQDYKGIAEDDTLYDNVPE